MSIAYEYEYESPVMEAEAFLESVQQAARSGRRYRPLALAAMAAARAALSEGRYGDVESELESGAPEGEWEVTPQAFHQSFVRREAGPSAALMEHLGHAAAEAESNGEAFAFLAPLLPLAMKALPLAGKALGLGAKALPKVASKVVKVAPKLIKGVNAAAKSLRGNPATKQLVQALPQIVRRTTATLARQAAQGAPITGEGAVRTLANQTAQILGNPAAALQALDRAKAVDQRLDQAVTATVQGGGGLASPPCTCGAQPE